MGQLRFKVLVKEFEMGIFEADILFLNPLSDLSFSDFFNGLDLRFAARKGSKTNII
jgi:hypothetical protein